MPRPPDKHAIDFKPVQATPALPPPQPPDPEIPRLEVPPFQDHPEVPSEIQRAEVPPFQEHADAGAQIDLGKVPAFQETPTVNASIELNPVQNFNVRGGQAQVITLFNPLRVPCLGQVSYPDPAGLRPGEWAQLQNLRLEDRGLRVRFGVSSLVAATHSSDTLYGVFVGMLNNTLTMVRAVYRTNGGLNKVVIEKADSATAPTSWSEISAASGKYGETRFSNSGYGVSFAVVKEVDTSGSAPLNNNRELLVIQNGIVEARVWDSVGSTMAKVVEVPALNRNSCRSEATWKYNLQIGTSSAVVFTGSDGDYTNVWAQTTGIQTTILTTVATGDDCNYLFPNSVAIGSLDDAPARQLHVVFKCTDTSIFQKMSVRVGDTGGTYYLIHDATATDSNKQNVLIVPMGGDYFLAAFSVANADNGGTPATPLLGLGVSLDRLQLEWQGGTLTTAIVLNIIAAGFGGAIQGGALFGLTLMNAGSHTESPGVVCRSIGGSRLDHVGGATSTGKGLSLPPDSRLYFDYKLDYELPSTAGPPSHGGEYLMVYMRPPGGTEYLFHTASQVYSYSGSWSETAAITTLRVRTLTVQTEVTTLRPMPDGEHRGIPIGSCMTTVSGRLAVGAVVRTTGDSQKGDVWISGDQHPFRFRQYVKYLGDNIPDLRSPTRLSFAGENVMGFARMSGTLLGADSLLIFTDAGLYSVDGVDTMQLSRPRRLGPYGTLAPRTIAEHNNVVYWLDQARHVRVLDARMTSLSKGRVEDVLTTYNAGTNLGGIHGVIHDERYHLWFSIAGSYTGTGIAQTNELGLVYDIQRDAWTYDYYTNAAINRAWGVSTTVLGEPYLYGFTATGALFRFEDPDATTTAGETIEWRMRSGVLSDDVWQPIEVGAVGLVMEKIASGTVTVTRVGFQDDDVSLQVASIISVDVSTDLAWRWDYSDATDKKPVAYAGLGARIWLVQSGSTNGGKRIFSVVAKVRQIDHVGPDVGA